MQNTNPEVLSQSQVTRTDLFNEKTNDNVDVVQANMKLPRKTARRVLRKEIRKQLGYSFGSIGASKFANMPSRKERRKLAKDQGVEFAPVYND